MRLAEAWATLGHSGSLPVCLPQVPVESGQADTKGREPADRKRSVGRKMMGMEGQGREEDRWDIRAQGEDGSDRERTRGDR